MYGLLWTLTIELINAGMPQLLPIRTTGGIWAALNFAAAMGLWSERTRHARICFTCPHPLLCLAHNLSSHLMLSNSVESLRCGKVNAKFFIMTCRVGKELSGPLVSTLVGLLFTNAGIVSGSNAPAVYDTVNKFILPLAIPLLLFSADLRCCHSLARQLSV